MRQGQQHSATGDSGNAITCRRCGLYRICFARRLEGGERHERQGVVRRGHEPLRAGQPVDGARLKGLSVLRSGALKRCRYSRNGEEIIAGFYFPGETLGLEWSPAGQEEERYVALEPAHVCHIPWQRIEGLMEEDGDVREAVNQMLREEITVERERLLRACRGSARQRVAAFLLDLAERRQRRSLSADRIRLGMGRREIAAYLDLTIETVSRTLSQFKRAGMIQLEGRRLQLMNGEALAAAADGVEGERLCG
ncbi:helix-turn-helix domain-containing protein [Arhodomonas aquaeolei]|uniref:helix-turn-helix domain-containing protein n=1 Tax=Arhodomonas aquaeolei TaxID=2369 RepID=UPI002168AD1C|nr:helix-turn-helix domain-containing protein [Arhodomonas aquaeolei]MCS4503711.1 helix-turn-helix domain-containing protein [Arhodomonas aquaeolei]